jgi:hypothetical protein
VVALSGAALVVTLVVIIVVGALVSGALIVVRRRRRSPALDIRPLTGIARQRYANQWTAIQERFVDAPAEAVAAARALVIAVLAERGYPVGQPDQVLADLAVDHQAAVGHFRAADEISGNPAPGAAVTEDLRLALIHYRELFRALLGDQAAAADPAAPADPAAGGEARRAAELTGAADPPGGEVRPAGAPHSMSADRASADWKANGLVDRMPGS